MKKLFLTFLIFLYINLTYSFINLPENVIKDEKIIFYFDAFDLLVEKKDILKNSSYFKDFSYYCKITKGEGELKLISSSLTIQIYELIPRKYGLLEIKCYSSVKNEKNIEFSAEISKRVFVIDDPKKICNKNDILISYDNVDLDYMNDIIPAVYRYIKEDKEQYLTSMQVIVDYSSVLGKIENPSLSCKVNDKRFYILEDFYKDIGSFTTFLNIFLKKEIDSYFSSFSISCEFEAFCNFYDNKFLSKPIKKNFTIVINVKPIKDSIFFVVNQKALNFSTKYFNDLLNNYSKRAALQTIEMKISPFILGIPGVLTDFFLNPVQVAVSQIIALAAPIEGCVCTSYLSPKIKTFCNPITGSGIECLKVSLVAYSAATSCSPTGKHTCIASAAILSKSISWYKNVYSSLAWIPLFFTTLTTTQSLPLTLNTVCDPVSNWIYEITGSGYLFPVINLYRYPPILPDDFSEIVQKEQEEYLEILEEEEDILSGYLKLNTFDFKSTVENQIKEISDTFQENPFMVPYKKVIEGSGKINNFLKYDGQKALDTILTPIKSLTNLEFFRKLREIYNKDVCGKAENKKDNPISRSGNILNDFFTIAIGTGTPDFTMIVRPFWSQILMSTMNFVAHFIKMEEQCIFYNTFYALSFLNEKFDSLGIRVNLKNNQEIELDLSLKKREYYKCPGEVSNSLSRYLNVIMANQRCFLSAINWIHLKNIDSNFEGDLTKILENNLTRFLLAYSNTNFVELKYSPLITEYNSIKELAYCSNLRKYMNCLEEIAVKECKKNKIKVSALYLAKTSSIFFSKFTSKIVTNSIFSLLSSSTPDFCGKLEKFRGFLRILGTAAQFYDMIESYKKTQECFEKNSKIDYKNVNVEEADKIRLDTQCEITKDYVTGTDCIFNPSKCSLTGWISFFSTVLDPNALDLYIRQKIDSQINKLVDDLIKKGSKKCKFEKEENFDEILFLDSYLNIIEDVNKELEKNLDDLEITTINYFKVKADEKELVKKINIEECNDSFYCSLVEQYYPFEKRGNFCIYKEVNSEIEISFVSSYESCEINLLFETARVGYIDYKRINLEKIDNCRGSKKITLNKAVLLNKISANYNSFTRGIFIEILPMENSNYLEEKKSLLPIDYNKLKESSYFVEKC